MATCALREARVCEANIAVRKAYYQQIVTKFQKQNGTVPISGNNPMPSNRLSHEAGLLRRDFA